ncbi:MAG: glycoside hydrolase family 3 C-terminal domain-containing protein [Chloroflexota bacterium]|nr:glycoside hydrolase family 3 C-terminal domain-containing protein [Chloroflexota bacterium]
MPDRGLDSTGVGEILARLTLQEKAALCSGQDFWNLEGVPRTGVPSIAVADGPHGLRKQRHTQDGFVQSSNVPATCFPTAVTLASTWDPDLLREVGAAIGEEARAEGVSVILGPGVNIKRSPLCGRNFEYYSEDPYLSSVLATAFVRGVQDMGVGTSLKHFAANNQETRRFSINAIVDERALREIYLASFEHVVKAARPWTVMAAYNRLNGPYCSEHPELLTGILRNEWGYQGLVMSDWGAVNQRVAGLEAGLDLEMPGLKNGRDGEIVEAVREGHLSMEVLDWAVERVLTLVSKAAATGLAPDDYDRDAHHHLARRAAGEGAVLLKNEGAVLPLTSDLSIALIGAFAKSPRYQGGGSSAVTPTRIDTAYDAIARRVGAGAMLTYAPGYDPKTDALAPALIDEAQQVAQEAEIALVFAGLPAFYETEGLDRQHMAMPAQHNSLIEAVAEVNPNTVVVLMNGAPLEMPWQVKVPAILEAYLGGQAGGAAVARLLYGEVNPSGKLAETFPFRLEDHPAHAFFTGGPRTVEYRESIYVGYRCYDTADKPVLFPFGHGLSYTTFSYTDLRLSASQMHDDGEIDVSVTITNTGTRAGREVVQLYVHDVESIVFRPTQELKGFAKVSLEPRKSTTVTIALNRRSFAYWDTGLRDWRVEAGEFEIRVGASSRDIRAVATVEVRTTHPRRPRVPEGDRLAEYCDLNGDTAFSRGAFAALHGRPLPANLPERRGEHTLNTPLCDIQGSLAAWLLRIVMRRQASTAISEDPDSPMARRAQEMLEEMPLRMWLLQAGGGVTPEVLGGLLELLNGRLIQGIRVILQAIRNRPS